MVEEPEKSLRRRLDDWLKTEGWPFEIRVGRELQKHGWKVRHGEFYTDPSSGTSREIDLLATISRPRNEEAINLDLVIECKTSRDKPWVGFTSPNYQRDPLGRGVIEVDVGDPLWARFFLESHLRWKNSTAEEQLVEPYPDPLDFADHLSEDPARWLDSWCEIAMVKRGMKTCHALVQAFRESKSDSAYSAIQQVENAARALSSSTRGLETTLADLGLNEFTLFMPIVVVNGLLFSASLDPHDLLTLEKTDHLHVRTERGMVLVLEDTAVERFAETAYRSADDALPLTAFEKDRDVPDDQVPSRVKARRYRGSSKKRSGQSRKGK